MNSLLYINYRDPMEIVPGIGLIDFLVIPFYLMVIYSIAYIIKGRYYRDNPIGKYMIWGLTGKILGGLGFAAIYIYYYEVKGDTFWYWDGAVAVREAFVDSIFLGLKVLMVPAGVFTEDTMQYTIRIPTFWKGNTEQVFMCKILGVVATLSFKTYWLATIILTTFSFTGMWRLYTVFYRIYPQHYKPLAIACLFVPSALFWGSGLIKDTICIGMLGWFFSSMYNLLVIRKAVVSSAILAAISFLVIFQLKAYIILGFLPAVFIWIYMRFKPDSEILFVKYMMAPIFLLMFFGAGALITRSLSTSSSKYAVENLETRTKGFHQYHGKLSEQAGQTGYSLGEISYTPTGVLSKAPAAINVTYFRPYLWEVDDPIQVFSSLESMAMFFLFLWVLWKVGLIRVIRIIRSNPEVALCLTFSLLFGFAVGFTAYNFGALVRFKIPGLPFFISGLLLIYFTYQEELRNQAPPIKRKSLSRRLAS